MKFNNLKAAIEQLKKHQYEIEYELKYIQKKPDDYVKKAVQHIEESIKKIEQELDDGKASQG